MQLNLDLTAPPARQAESDPTRKSDGIYSVSEITRKVRLCLERGFADIWVKGEVSNFRPYSSGHLYFSIKDADASLSCVMFAGAAAGLGATRLADGLRVELHGKLSVFERRGQYQLVVQEVRACGAGELHAKFEALKKKLEAEGLFAPEKKRPLPKFPARIGVVTSPSGAAIRDFLNVLHRRHPGIGVVINPVRVQGVGAAAEIVRAVREFGEPRRWGLPPVDVIVVTRGGGSIEDLWEFNEEAVARAIAGSPVPVVSAVGHEIDFTICDFVSDYRAPTPSAAAEILSADAAEVRIRLEREGRRMARACAGVREGLRLRLDGALGSAIFRDPLRQVEECTQRLDRAALDLRRAPVECLRHLHHRLLALEPVLAPATLLEKIENFRLRLERASQRLASPAEKRVAALLANLGELSGKIFALDPARVLERGFTVTLDSAGVVLRTASQARAAVHLQTRFSDGTVESKV